MYPLQLFLGNYDEKKFDKIRNIKNCNKPCGGLWTSSLWEGTRYSDWVRFLKTEHYSHHSIIDKVGTIIKALPGVRLYEADDDNTGVDFELLSHDYDGLWWRHNYTHGWFWGWDVESTLWFHPSFEVVEKVEISVEISSEI
jgi:hypothetical protein